MRIPFYLVTGFLGSGKTTFLRNIIAGYSDLNRIAIVQNEFAPTGVDGIDLKMTGADFNLVEINNGSVFCVCLMATFVESLEKVIADYKPEMIFLEASGLADPINIIELLGREGLKDRVGLANVITIVDAPNFERGMKILPRFRHQIMIADTVMVNKSDIFKGSNSLLSDNIHYLNPFARIIETAYCKTDMDGLIWKYNNASKFKDNAIPYENSGGSDTNIGPSARKKSPDGFPVSGSIHKAAAAFTGRKPAGRPDINACVFRTHEKLSSVGLNAFIKKMQESSPRIKGFVNLKDGSIVAVQSVFDIFELKEIAGYSGPTEIIAFGKDLTPRYLKDMFKIYSGY